MKKEKQITPLSQFPTEVLVFYFKKFRTVRHYEYENEWCDWVVEDKTTMPFEYDDAEDETEVYNMPEAIKNATLQEV